MTGTLETPSGKNANSENFPVGSLLIAKELRPAVLCYYNFARAIDDIADNPALDSDEKIARLDAMDQALAGQASDGSEKADKVCQLFNGRQLDIAHCRDLISAFKQDARQNRYDDWAQLLDYCNRSAAPVGRFLLELHGEDEAGYEASNALCNALQVINHLQDCAEDLVEMDRVYLPQNWLKEANVEIDDLRRPQTTAALREVFDKCLQATQELLHDAATLVPQLKSKRLAMEAGVITAIAHQLCAELVKRDPLAEKIKLSKWQIMRLTMIGAGRGMIGR